MLMTDMEPGLCETEKSYKMVSNERGANLYWLRLPHGVTYFFDKSSIWRMKQNVFLG